MTNDDNNDGDGGGERVLQQYNDPITGAAILRIVQLSNGLWAVDLLSETAVAIGRQLLPPTPAIMTRADGEPGQRWLYKRPPADGKNS
jgi:hypothetical protein